MAARRPLDGLHQLLGQSSLEQVAGRAGVEHLGDRGVVVVGRQREDADVRRGAAEVGRYAYAPAAAHPDIDQGDRREQPASELDRLCGIARDADQLQLRRALHDFGDGRPELGVVVRDQDRDGGGGLGHGVPA